MKTFLLHLATGGVINQDTLVNGKKITEEKQLKKLLFVHARYNFETTDPDFINSNYTLNIDKKLINLNDFLKLEGEKS